LTPGDPEIGHQHGFNRTDLRRRFPKPAEDRIFFVTCRAGHAADAIAFRQLGQRFDNFIRRGLAPIKQSPFRCGERVMTAPTLIALLPITGATKFDNVPGRYRLWFPIISAVRIGTEIARLD
jgi:hypothetical protein